MSDIKYKPIEALSGWMEYRLAATDKLDPPVFRCRLRPVDTFNLIDGIPADGKMKMGRATVEIAIDAIAEWDLAIEGVPIPLTSENKMGWLRPIIAEPLDRPDKQLLGVAILLDAQNRENFLKNLSPSSPGITT